VVSEPDIRSAAEAAEYMRALRQLVRYLGIGEGDMEKGQLRCDANVSIRPRGSEALGTRTELKNINSFKFVEKAIDNEIARQVRVIEGGSAVVQETRLWDSDAGQSRSMRGKEEALDYRYFPDPDLPPLRVEAAEIDRVRRSLPELPLARRKRYRALELSDEDARTLGEERPTADYFDAVCAALGETAKAARLASNWIQAELFRELNRLEQSIDECSVAPQSLADLVALVEDGTISGKIAKKVLTAMFESGDEPRAIVEREGLMQISDTGAIEALVEQAIADNPKQAEQYRGGKDKMLGFFVGQVMKASKGQANPQMVNELLVKKLKGE
jgi:aspartyl-tRNA(Asn)/glutamyl-tRNA(Gln) amidotransferase subunit B